MQRSSFNVPKMDCPSEENLVRMALQDMPELSLSFDLKQRQVTVLHRASADEVLARLTRLGLGAALQSSEAVHDDAVPLPDAGDVAELKVLRMLLGINAAMFVIEVVLGLLAQSAGLLVWAVVNAVLVKLALTEYLPVNLLAGFMGISAVVVIASLVSSHPWAGWLNTLGKNSIAIYLGFYLPMIVIVPALQASPIGRSPSLVATISMVSVIGIAMGAFHLANRIGLAFLYNRPNWIRLVQPGQRSASARASVPSGSVAS